MLKKVILFNKELTFDKNTQSHAYLPNFEQSEEIYLNTNLIRFIKTDERNKKPFWKLTLDEGIIFVSPFEV